MKNSPKQIPRAVLLFVLPLGLVMSCQEEIPPENTAPDTAGPVGNGYAMRTSTGKSLFGGEYA
ncbi:hypothetical protein FKX85_09535 [Echinicola soli]|uniref:Uncharacterized protein n=1 Tax=Echinicola soli TaxID=2591634 RepID=A0A514CHL2_9BACT|nr:hypothetical protein [Echinicola soli]QDH79260.1 hypothetical protein FKX85_09535 [Echinicola soli]